jgi:hypothetical protein
LVLLTVPSSLWFWMSVIRLIVSVPGDGVVVRAVADDDVRLDRGVLLGHVEAAVRAELERCRVAQRCARQAARAEGDGQVRDTLTLERRSSTWVVVAVWVIVTSPTSNPTPFGS